MEAIILACYPARSTECLDCHPNRVNYDVFTQAPFELCQRENLLDEAKVVDVTAFAGMKWRDRRSFSDLVTAKQFSLPRLRSNSVVHRPWKGAQTS